MHRARKDSHDCYIALLPTDLLLRVLSTPGIGARDLAACGETCRLFRQIPAGSTGSDAIILTEAAARAGCLRSFQDKHFRVTLSDFFPPHRDAFALPRGLSLTVDYRRMVYQVDTQQRISERCHHSWTVQLHYLQVRQIFRQIPFPMSDSHVRRGGLPCAALACL